jgi:hypothetical protein
MLYCHLLHRWLLASGPQHRLDDASPAVHAPLCILRVQGCLHTLQANSKPASQPNSNQHARAALQKRVCFKDTSGSPQMGSLLHVRRQQKAFAGKLAVAAANEAVAGL